MQFGSRRVDIYFSRMRERKKSSRQFSRRWTMIKCSLLNFSNRRGASFFHNCRSFTLISFYFDLLPFHNLHTFPYVSARVPPPTSVSFHSRLCTTFSLLNPPSFSSIKYLTKQIFGKDDIIDSVVIVSHVLNVISML